MFWSRRFVVLLVMAIVVGMGGVVVSPVAVRGEVNAPRVTLQPVESVPNDAFGLAVALDQGTLAATAVDAAYIYERDASSGAWAQQARLTFDDGPDADQLVATVDVAGDTVVVGVVWVDVDEIGDQSAVYIFDRNAGGADNWGLVKKLVSAPGITDDLFGLALALDGDRLAVGASDADVDVGGTVNEGQGAVFVYERDAGGPNNWGLMRRLEQADGDVEDDFGTAVALQGDTLFVGAPDAEAAGVNGEGHGLVYVYGRNEGGAENWGLVATLRAVDAETYRNFGVLVRVDGDTLAIASGLEDRLDDAPEEQVPSAVHVFARNAEDGWDAVTMVMPPEDAAASSFGYGLALEGDQLVIGASLLPLCGRPQHGAMYVATRDAGGEDAWGIVQRLAGGTSSVLGFSIALDGGMIVAGAPGVTTQATGERGAVYVDPSGPGACAWLPWQRKQG